MTLAELIREFRILAFDEVEPYLFSDDKITHWLNDGVKEACVRGRLLHECDDADMCQIIIKAGQNKYPTHPKLYEITHASIVLPSVNGGKRTPVCLISFEEASSNNGDWRYDTQDELIQIIQHDTYIRLSHTLNEDGMIYLEGHRLPNEITEYDDVPEIHLAHHAHLIDWALHKAFSIPDSEVFDVNKSQMAKERFTEYFGLQTDSDLKRITCHDVPHTVKPFWV